MLSPPVPSPFVMSPPCSMKSASARHESSNGWLQETWDDAVEAAPLVVEGVAVLSLVISQT